jgi:hypothetical protein
MLTSKMYIRTAWSDYFTGSPTLFQSNEYKTRPTYTNTSVHVSNCLFISITSTSDGGALSCTSVTCLLVESSSFFSCRTSSNGGAINFGNTNDGQCVLYEVCGYNCCSTYTGSYSHGQFSHVKVQDSISSKNHVNYSSISRCVNEITDSRHTMYHYNGMIFCQSINISMNKCDARSGIFCYPLFDSNSVTCSLSYSSITDNVAIGFTCIRLYKTGAIYEFRSCNILRNTQGTLGTEGTILSPGNLTIADSCILENKAAYIFNQASSSYSTTLSQCTIDLTSNNGNLIIQKTAAKSFIHALDHMSTQNCHSEYDSAGILTPVTKPPSSSPSNKQKLYCSCHCLLYQSLLKNFISLPSILIFNFIHPYSSI